MVPVAVRCGPGRSRDPGQERPAAAAYDPSVFDPRRTVGEELAAQGTVLLLETVGRLTGRVSRAAVGFIESPDGSLLVAAASPTADWALNLRAQPRCRASRAGSSRAYEAEELQGRERNDAIVSLILKYGTPSERLGAGPAFRLRPAG